MNHDISCALFCRCQPLISRLLKFSFACASAAFFLLPLIAAEAPMAATSDLSELPLEVLMEIEVPTVYSASKFEQKSSAAPAAVTVITAEEIKRYGHRTLADVLRSVPGLYVSYDRNYSFLGIGGINLGDFNSRVLLLVNGHRVNNNLTDGAALGRESIVDVDLIDRVEVIQGPGSVLYGNNAFFGVINVVTREGKQLNGAEVSGEYGSFDTGKARVTYGRQFTNGVEVLFSGTYYESAGADRLYYPEFDTPAQNNGIAEHIDGERLGKFFGSVGYRAFTLEGGFVHREKENPTAQYGTLFNDDRLTITDTRGYGALKFSREFDHGIGVSASGYYDQSGLALRYPLAAPFNLFKQQLDGEWAGTELLVTKKLDGGHILSLGGEYRNDFHQADRLFQAGTTNVFRDVTNDRQNYSFYGQGDFALRTNLHVNLGVRYDKYTDFDPSWSPRAATICDFLSASTVKLIYGTAFRNPNFLELSDPRFQDIEPEKITSGQVVYEQGLNRNLRSSVVGYYNQIEDLIIFENGAFTNFNVETLGLTLALDGKWESGIRGRVSYGIQHTENRDSGAEMPDSPEHLVKFNASVPLVREKVFAGLEVQFTSRRRTVFTDLSGSTLTGESTPPFALVNFTLFSQDLIKNLEASASIYNLLDTTCYDPAARLHLQDRIRRDGRSFRLKLTYRF